MPSPFDPWRNPDGKTFNGVAMLADLTGISQAEIAWTSARLKALMHDEGMTKADALSIVREERKGKPWAS